MSEEQQTVFTNEKKECETSVDKQNDVISSDEQPNDLDLSDDKKATAKPSRELKLLLALSKEANLDTNIGYKRKTLESGKIENERRNSSGSNPDSAAKRSMRSQNPEFLAKHHKFISKINLFDSELQNSSSENEDKPLKDQDGSFSKVSKRKKESLLESIIGGSIEGSSKKIRKSLLTEALMDKHKDLFCWRCHRDDVAVSCETCPRSFHLKCLKQSVNNPDHWPCPECVSILKAESTKTRSPAMKDMTLEHLCGLLKFALKRMMQCVGCEPFLQPVNEVEFPDYKKYIVQPMDLIKLEQNIKENIYGSTQAFEADAKWLLHDSIIFNSYQSKLTSVAKGIIKICKQEMSEIENCSTCYLNANTKKNTWFVEVCPKPHRLIWAKLKGFPYWPAKAMRTNSGGMVDCRFFGAHDRAWVPFKECFLYSQKDPNSKKRNDINECIKELEIHIENLKKVYGEFNYAPYRTPFLPDKDVEQLQMFLPKYEPNLKITFDKLKPPRKEKSGLKRSKSDPEANLIESKIEDGKETELHARSKSFNDTMEGYGTDDEEMDWDSENDTANCDNECNKSDAKSENDDEDFETQIEANVITDHRNYRGGNVRTRGGYSNNTGKIKVIPRQVTPPELMKRFSTDERSDTSSKFSRRNSDQSIKSDSSRLSNLSEKINRVDMAENMEISLGNSDVITSETNSTGTVQSQLLDVSAEAKRKPIVQVNISAHENSEFTISPPTKSRIADRLMKKLTEEATSSSDNLKVEAVKKQLDKTEDESDCGSNCSKKEAFSHTDLLMKKFKAKSEMFGSIEKVTEISLETEIFEPTNSTAEVPEKPVEPALEKDLETISEFLPEVEISKVNSNEKPEVTSSDEEKASTSEKISLTRSVDVIPVRKQNKPEENLLKIPTETLITIQENLSEESEDLEQSSLFLEETQIDEANIRNIIHSSLNEIPEKKGKSKPEISEINSMAPKKRLSGRKRPAENNEESVTLQSKLIKLVAESKKANKNMEDKGRSILQESLAAKTVKEKEAEPNAERAACSKGEGSHLDDCDGLCSFIKNEPQSSDEECSDVEYMEAKRKYLSALNISEKMPEKPKLKEIRTRSKTDPPVKFQVIDNLSRTIDNVATHCSEERKQEALILQNLEKRKDINIKPLPKVTQLKQKARKSFPSAGAAAITKQVYPSPKKSLLKIKSKIVPVTSINPIVPVTSINLIKPVNTVSTISERGKNLNSNLPPNQPIGYSTSVGSPILTMIQHPITSFTNLNSDVSITNKSDSLSRSLLSPSVTLTQTNPVPPLAQLTPTQHISTVNIAPTDQSEDLRFLNDVIPENLTKAVSELLCKPPPKLKPRPPGPLATNFQEGLPSSAGAVTSRINSISHRLGDYFRGMIVEMLEELGTVENPEAEITKLKLANEELKHRHTEEILEIKKNVSSILKDIQKSIVEERSRIIEDTRSSCEAEAIKRVEEAKSKQWCANCSKEAQFFCCWNTSYCDYPCQQRHWTKHMSKCTQNSPTANSSQSGISLKNQAPVVLRQTQPVKGMTPKSFSKTLVAKPTKVIVNRANSNKPINIVRTSTGSHLTLVESTPGNYELVGNGPIAVGGKFLTNSSIISKIKSGNIISVSSSPPTSTNSTATSVTSQKTFVLAQQKTNIPTPDKHANVISDDDSE